MAIGAFGTGGQLLWTRALKLGDVSALTPISFLQLPLVAFAAWLLFGEDPSRWTILGAAIIFIANAYIAHREVQLARRAATNAPVEAAKPAAEFPRIPQSPSRRGPATAPGRSP